VKTEATTGKGVGDLVGEIERFRAHTASAQGLRRRARAEFRLRELLGHRFLHHVERYVLPEGDSTRISIGWRRASSIRTPRPTTSCGGRWDAEADWAATNREGAGES